MSRPGLAASRSIDIIEFLALSPEKEFTLSEIVRATQINNASCYAVLNRLTDRGYLTRCPDQKTYSLGPALIAMGQAGFKSQPIIARAKQAAESLFAELDVPVLLNTVVGEEILVVIALDDGSGRSPGMWVGERVPLVPPVGAAFLAWASDDAVDAWIAKRIPPPDAQLVEEWRRDLVLTRQRGYKVNIRAPNGPSLATLMAEMASGRHDADYRDEVTRRINSLDSSHRSQPKRIVNDELYEVLLIAAPIFDQNGQATFNLCLGEFPQKLTGAMITNYADRLMQTCLDVMRADRSQFRRRDGAAAESVSSHSTRKMRVQPAAGK